MAIERFAVTANAHARSAPAARPRQVAIAARSNRGVPLPSLSNANFARCAPALISPRTMPLMPTPEGPAMLRLWHYPADENPFTWTVVAAKRGHLVRRSLGLEVNPTRALGQSVFETEIPQKVFATIMGELQRVNVCPVFSCERVLDASSFGVEIDRYLDPVRLTWAGAAPVGWGTLAACHWRAVHGLNKLLPRTADLPYEYRTGNRLNFDED